MARFAKIAVACLTVFFLISCTDGQHARPDEKVAVPSESVALEIHVTEDGSGLTIKKSALDQEFLLQGSVAMQREFGSHIGNTTSSGIKSRIVVFQEKGDELVMLEANKGRVTGDEIPSHALITTFPISDSTDDEITFDFNDGMTNVVMSWDWYVSDYMGKQIKPDEMLFIDKSYIRETKEENGAITIAQTIAAKQGGSVVPIEMTYYLTRYKENSNFERVVSPGFDYLGYFESNPIVQKDFGMPVTFITKWDTTKPIKFYVSSEVPKEYRETVREGILYWNKVFGKSVLEAEIAPEEITAPDFKHNIVQWHTDYENTGAYADAQVDPRTGEILHAQVFLSAALAKVIDAFYIPRIERELDAQQILLAESAEGKEPPTQIISAKEIDETKLCTLSLDEIFNDIYMNRDLINDLSPERNNTLTKDLLRSIVAHEMGHIMGLRHNFAASSVNEWSHEEKKSILKAFVKTGKLPGDFKAPANSVMDYLSTADELIIGTYITRNALDYDKYAIDWGYAGLGQDPEFEGHPFCTDSHVGVFADCFRNDEGKHIVERRAKSTVEKLEKLPWLLAESYAMAKSDYNPIFRRPVKESTPRATQLASTVTSAFNNLLDLLADNFFLLSIYNEYPDLTDVDSGKFYGETMEWLDKEIKSAGGIDGIFELIDPAKYKERIETLNKKFGELITSDAYKELPLFEGGAISFTKDEIEYMKKRAGELFPAVDEDIVYMVTSALSNRQLNLIESVEKAEEIIAKWAEYVVTEGVSNDFRYSLGTRWDAAKLLRFGNGPLPNWLSKFIPEIAKKLKDQMEKVYGMPIEEIKPETFPREVQEFVRSELDLYYSLAGNYPTDPVTIDYKE